MGKNNFECHSCGQLTSRMEKASNFSYYQYKQLLQKLIELEQRGNIEMFAGDCPLEDTCTVLDTELHYTVCHYLYALL